MAQLYNEHGPGCVRLGNWAEEEALAALTGIRRCGDPREAKKISCSKRVIDHTEHTEPKDYNSTTLQTFADPAQDPNAPNRHVYMRVPPRAARALQAHREQVSKERAARDEEERRRREERDLSTVVRDSYTRFSEDAMRAAIPVRKVRGGGNRAQQPSVAPACGSASSPQQRPVYDYLHDAAITSWDPSAASARRFGRASGFTNPDAFTLDGEPERDGSGGSGLAATEAGLPLGLGGSAARLVLCLRQRLVRAACERAGASGGPPSVAPFAQRIAAAADACGMLSVDALRRALSASGTPPTDAELAACVEALEISSGSSGGGSGAMGVGSRAKGARVSGGEAVVLLRAPLTHARHEALQRAWAAAVGDNNYDNDEGAAVVPCDALPGGGAAWRAQARADGALGWQEFAEAGWCLSCCCARDDAFFQLLQL
ncbi:hypothetical protein JKP88DRAFT_265186 [Tribonema minus]|uniref:Uncharacterized protein n=1 Tax=Tribonema minus TaxID=303371 RepID=A0A836CA95_9STRA|nr:hypothetical protein JKP88DRAFT_265186 [Tribonema minus]